MGWAAHGLHCISQAVGLPEGTFHHLGFTNCRCSSTHHHLVSDILQGIWYIGYGVAFFQHCCLQHLESPNVAFLGVEGEEITRELEGRPE